MLIAERDLDERVEDSRGKKMAELEAERLSQFSEVGYTNRVGG